MGKSESYFRTIGEFRDRFRKEPTVKLKARLASGLPLVKEAAIALREVLEERAGGNESLNDLNEETVEA